MAIAAIGTAFEASCGWRLVHHGHELAAGFFQAGSMGLLESFVHEAEVHTDHVGPAEFQLFGDDPSGQRPPGLDTQTVPVMVIAGNAGLPAAPGRLRGHPRASAKSSCEPESCQRQEWGSGVFSQAGGNVRMTGQAQGVDRQGA